MRPKIKITKKLSFLNVIWKKMYNDDSSGWPEVLYNEDFPPYFPERKLSQNKFTMALSYDISQLCRTAKQYCDYIT